MTLSRNAQRLAAAVLALAAVVAVLGVLRFKRYVDEDPRLCATCHRASPEFALWMGGSHRSVACQRCHHATPEQGVAMLRAFIAGRPPSGRHAEVEVGSCAECHFSHDPQWPLVGGSRGHRIHFEENGIACVRCHAESMHGFEPVASKCQDCHPGHAVSVEGMHALHCFACHEFLTHEPGLRPTRRDCMRCHTAQGIHAPMHEAEAKMECASCHQPHRPEGQTLAACAECHTPARMAAGGLHVRHAATRCLECHPPHTWAATGESCLGCHAKATAHAGGRACLECHAFAGAERPPRPAIGDPP